MDHLINYCTEDDVAKSGLSELYGSWLKNIVKKYIF